MQTYQRTNSSVRLESWRRSKVVSGKQRCIHTERSARDRAIPGLAQYDFGAILIDPPWPYSTYSAKGEGRSAKRHYSTLSLEEIKTLPVAAHAARDCWLFAWCPAPSTRFLMEVLDVWGFEFSGIGFTWVKTTRRAIVTPFSVTASPNAKSPFHFGMGHTTRANAEFCWLAKRRWMNYARC
jgi:N6-adenosine-specific RNA methylase IME4